MGVDTVSGTIDNPNVVVRVYDDGECLPIQVCLRIDQVSFHPNSYLKGVERQLDEIEELGRKILGAVERARGAHVVRSGDGG